MDKNSLNPGFSLLVPCYNAEKYIDGFLENISALIKPFDEVIFYDDASADGTYEILVSKGCSVIKGSQNKGPGFARNTLASQSKCDWFHFHDIDDRLTPDYLAGTSAIVQNNEKIDVVLCNVDWYDAQSNKIVLSWRYSNEGINNSSVAYTIANPIGGINGLYRKSKFIQSGGFNTNVRVWEDADLHVKLASAGAVFHVVEDVLSYSLRYPETTSSDQGAAWQIRASLLQQYFEIFKDETVRAEIGKQAQAAAGNLIRYGQLNAARTAFRLSERCGIKVPYGSSVPWKILKRLLPKGARTELRLLHLRWVFKEK